MELLRIAQTSRYMANHPQGSLAIFSRAPRRASSYLNKLGGFGTVTWPICWCPRPVEVPETAVITALEVTMKSKQKSVYNLAKQGKIVPKKMKTCKSKCDLQVAPMFLKDECIPQYNVWPPAYPCMSEYWWTTPQSSYSPPKDSEFILILWYIYIYVHTYLLVLIGLFIFCCLFTSDLFLLISNHIYHIYRIYLYLYIYTSNVVSIGLCTFMTLCHISV